MKIMIQFQSKIQYPFHYVISVCNQEDLKGVQYSGTMYEGDSIEVEVPGLKLVEVKR